MYKVLIYKPNNKGDGDGVVQELRERLMVLSEGRHRVKLESKVGTGHWSGQGEQVTLWLVMKVRFK